MSPSDPDAPDPAPDAPDPPDQVRERRAWWSYHEEIKNFVQAAAILIAGLWIGAVWLYDNWLEERLERPVARLSVEIVGSGALSETENYLRVKVVASNISKRQFFNYGNALTVRSVTVQDRPAVADPMEPLGTYITSPTNRQRAWVYETGLERNTSAVIAYSQYMSQGYVLQPSESYTNVVTVLVPKTAPMISLSARLTFGVKDSVWGHNEKISGGLAIDKNGDLAACAARLDDKRKFQTPCNEDYSDAFYIRSTYAETSFIFPQDLRSTP